ncbi:hypothetical protein [Thomasclavelia ramosa]|uniref:hypothetical protein n=1 Tax=Thomasclavelia ramosa TaxID=1547 RepID=UPI000E418620|nr:hypothetical protein [Thomasclavelia ramosa]RGC87943.1 hypothetical protein DW242_16720 [Thomasclavelia ramosa]
MSYCITLTFYPDIKANQVFKKAQQIAKNKLDNFEKVIDENYPYCPASMYNANYFSIEEYRKKRLYNLEKLWIENIFTKTFLYWKEFNLLAVVGYDINGATTITFQNFTDQNYEYTEWNGVPLFENLVQLAKMAPIENIKYYRDDNDEYCRKTYAYDLIYEQLNIEDIFTNKFMEKHDYFKLSMLNEEKSTQCHQYLKKRLLNELKSFLE